MRILTEPARRAASDASRSVAGAGLEGAVVTTAARRPAGMMANYILIVLTVCLEREESGVEALR